MSVTIRLAAPRDAADVAAIYAPYCEATSVSFETTAPSAEDMATRIAAIERECPWLVLDVGGRAAGYAYASRHRERAAYMWAVDTAVYVGRLSPAGCRLRLVDDALRASRSAGLRQGLRGNYVAERRERPIARDDGLHARRNVSPNWIQARSLARRRLVPDGPES